MLCSYSVLQLCFVALNSLLPHIQFFLLESIDFQLQQFKIHFSARPTKLAGNEGVGSIGQNSLQGGLTLYGLLQQHLYKWPALKSLQVWVRWWFSAVTKAGCFCLFLHLPKSRVQPVAWTGNIQGAPHLFAVSDLSGCSEI